MRYVEIAARLLVGTVFVVAVAGKVNGRSAYRAYVLSLQQMKVLPSHRVAAVAGGSLAVEGAIVVLLAVPLRCIAAVGFVLAAGLLAVFASAISVSLRRGNRAPCRCFGASTTSLGRGHIVRNLVLVAVSVAGLVTALLPGAGPAMAGGIVAALTGLVTGVLVTAYDDIAGLWRSPSVNASTRAATGPTAAVHVLVRRQDDLAHQRLPAEAGGDVPA